MEDIMHIQSLFLRRAISKAAGKALEKQGYDAAIQLNDLRVNHTDERKSLRVHLDIDMNLSEKDLTDILTRAGIL